MEARGTARELELRTYTLDTSDWPMVVVGNVRGAKEGNIGEFARIYAHLIEKERPFVSIHDARWSPTWTALDRQTMFEFLRREEPRLRRLVAAHVVLIKGAIARGMVNAIFWGTPFRDRMRIAADLDEAKAWGREAYERFGKR